MNELSLVLNMPSTEPAFDQLFLELFNQVFSYELRLVGEVAVAHKLTEETYAALARYYRKGKAPNEPKALLFLLATARAREYLKKGDHQSFFRRFFAKPDEPTVEFTEIHVSGLTSDTSQRALSTLEFNSQVVLLLHDYCGLSYAEVSHAAAIGRSAVPRDLDRARREFKQAYDYIKF